MNVGELKEHLKNYNEDAEVIIRRCIPIGFSDIQFSEYPVSRLGYYGCEDKDVFLINIEEDYHES